MALQQVVLPPDALTLAKAQLKLKGPLQGTNYSDEYDYYALQPFRYKSNDYNTPAQSKAASQINATLVGLCILCLLYFFCI